MQARLSNIISRIEDLLDGGGSIIVAIDGRCGSGKTTLADAMVSRWGDACSVFHMDDFFLRPQQRTPERLSAPGENVDHERFLEEVLGPLHSNKPIEYRRYDCHRQAFDDVRIIQPVQINIVEGTYSMHPDLAEYYNLKVFLDIDQELQKKRIENRNTPEMADRFFKEWIPMEEMYFDELGIRDKADIVYEIKE